jgi:catechol 2,3-dioxygenase-like lactoylglutathione lyase family enzyme
MARIQHIAIFAKDNAALAEFYKTTFGMEEVFRQPAGKDREAYYLSDGHINLALLPAGPNGKEGIDHFGFQTDDVALTSATATSAGARHGATAVPRDGRFNDAFILDPVGTRVDLSAEGWATSKVQASPEERAAAKAV